LETVFEFKMVTFFVAVRRVTLTPHPVVSLRPRGVHAKCNRCGVALDLYLDWHCARTKGLDRVRVCRKLCFGTRDAVVPSDGRRAAFFGDGSTYTIIYGGNASNYFEAPSLGRHAITPCLN
jgi:hypothetical protein